MQWNIFITFFLLLIKNSHFTGIALLKEINFSKQYISRIFKRDRTTPLKHPTIFATIDCFSFCFFLAFYKRFLILPLISCFHFDFELHHVLINFFPFAINLTFSQCSKLELIQPVSQLRISSLPLIYRLLSQINSCFQCLRIHLEEEDLETSLNGENI